MEVILETKQFDCDMFCILNCNINTPCRRTENILSSSIEEPMGVQRGNKGKESIYA